MGGAIELLLPAFGLIALGLAAARRELIDAGGLRGINDFTVKFAFPALLFGGMARGSPLQAFGGAGIYLIGCLGVFGLAMLLAQHALQMNLACRAAFAINASYGSAAYLATPIVKAAYGTDGVSIIVPIVALHSGVMLPLAALLIEIGERGVHIARWHTIARGIATNPVLVAVGLGFAWSRLGIPLPGPAASLLTLLSDAAPGLALFCVGASLPRVAVGYVKEAVLGTMLKLGVLPIVIGTLSAVFGVSGLPLKVALITAAMPTGANAFIVARRAAAFAGASAQIVVTTLAMSALLLSGLLFELK